MKDPPSPANAGLFACGFCGQAFFTAALLEIHQKQAHPDADRGTGGSR